MPKHKSLIHRLAVDVAGRAHGCQHNARHRLSQGERRLKFTKERSIEHFCVECGIAMIEESVAALMKLKSELQGQEASKEPDPFVPGLYGTVPPRVQGSFLQP